MSDGGFDVDKLIQQRRNELNLFGIVTDPITKQRVSFPSISLNSISDENKSEISLAKDEIYDIVDKYARLAEEKKSIERELELLKKEVVRLSKDRKTETLNGKNAILRVKITTEIKFPRANEPQRLILEQILKENEKWSDVSSLSISKLSKALSSNNWTDYLRERVLQFSHKEESSRITIENYRHQV
ncbi:MAG: hypothetical protein H5T43_00785 [Methanomethylovorans sp.]|jgi:hypothetical protein|nr:hypothetical protein [Methanomethylovorans sp.]